MTMKNKLVLTLTAADVKYKRFAVRALYQTNPYFFPGLGTDFELHTNVGAIKTNVRKKTYRIGKGLRPWFRAHSQLQTGARIEFEKISPGIFRLS